MPRAIADRTRWDQKAMARALRHGESPRIVTPSITCSSSPVRFCAIYFHSAQLRCGCIGHLHAYTGQVHCSASIRSHRQLTKRALGQSDNICPPSQIHFVLARECPCVRTMSTFPTDITLVRDWFNTVIPGAQSKGAAKPVTPPQPQSLPLSSDGSDSVSLPRRWRRLAPRHPPQHARTRVFESTTRR